MPATPERGGAPTRFALIGAGRFGAFVLAAAAELPDLACRAVVDADGAAAQKLAAAVACSAVDSVDLDDLLATGELDAVVIATPPGSHAPLVRRALANGLDVFCEKPIATSIADADELVATAERSRVIVVDHVLRYNPLLQAVRRIQHAMGWTVTRFLFENDAADESLPRGHWFWDEATSGGIFVEHGVHFFDAAAMFIDQPATAVSAVATSRDGWPGPDLVTATVTHGAALATYTHSFTHAHRAERQLMRIDYGPAEVRIRGWIPVDAEIVAFTDPAGRDRLLDLTATMTTPDVQVTVEPAGGPSTARGRGVEFAASQRLTLRLTLGGEPAKAAVYRAAVMAALQDLHDCRIHRERGPRSGLVSATEALRSAVAATESARVGRSVRIRAPTIATGQLARLRL